MSDKSLKILQKSDKIKQLLLRLNSVKEHNSDLSELVAVLKELKSLFAQYLLQRQLTELKEVVKEIKNDAKPEKDEQKSKFITESELKQYDNADERGLLLQNLANMTATKQENGKNIYLLHRVTPNFEYSQCAHPMKEKPQSVAIEPNGNPAEAANLIYETKKNTDWLPDFDSAQELKIGVNPLVSCWIPEDAIIGSPSPSENVGTWGDLGQNNAKKQMIIEVKPGQYEIKMEYKG